jgi:hyaluronan synthase
VVTGIRARRSRGVVVVVSGLTLLAIAAWGTTLFFSGAILSAGFLLITWNALLYSSERRREGDLPIGGHLTVIVPAYNEEPVLLRRLLESCLAQTRLPDSIVVVDDGSVIDYRGVRGDFFRAADASGVEPRWYRQPNRGKRSAQARAIEATPAADFYLTVDSDAVLDPDAFHEILKPLSDGYVHSVAGIVLPENNTERLLARIIDLLWVTAQLCGRSALSTLGSVTVNSGAFAVYRAELVRLHLGNYVGQRIGGSPMRLGDDAMMTLYALTRGLAVQQATAFCFTNTPTTVGGHLKQYKRWQLAGWMLVPWRLKYLPLSSYAYYAFCLHLLGNVLAAVSTVVVLVMLGRQRIDPIPLLTVGLLVAYGGSLRYLTIRRTDQPRRSQLATFLLTPFTMLWSAFVIGPLRWYCLLLLLSSKRRGGTRTMYAHREVAVAAPWMHVDLLQGSTRARNKRQATPIRFERFSFASGSAPHRWAPTAPGPATIRA